MEATTISGRVDLPITTGLIVLAAVAGLVLLGKLEVSVG